MVHQGYIDVICFIQNTHFDKIHIYLNHLLLPNIINNKYENFLENIITVLYILIYFTFFLKTYIYYI